MGRNGPSSRQTVRRVRLPTAVPAGSGGLMRRMTWAQHVLTYVGLGTGECDL